MKMSQYCLDYTLVCTWHIFLNAWALHLWHLHTPFLTTYLLTILFLQHYRYCDTTYMTWHIRPSPIIHCAILTSWRDHGTRLAINIIILCFKRHPKYVHYLFTYNNIINVDQRWKSGWLLDQPDGLLNLCISEHTSIINGWVSDALMYSRTFW